MEAVENLWTPQFSNDPSEVGLAEPKLSFQRNNFFLSFLKCTRDSYLPWGRMQSLEEEDAGGLPGSPCPGPCLCLSEMSFLPPLGAQHCPSWGGLESASRFLSTSASPVRQLHFSPSLSLSKRPVESKRSGVHCHLFLLLRASGLASPSFSFLSCELEIKNSSAHMGPSLLWVFYSCARDHTVYYITLYSSWFIDY